MANGPDIFQMLLVFRNRRIVRNERTKKARAFRRQIERVEFERNRARRPECLRTVDATSTPSTQHRSTSVELICSSASATGSVIGPYRDAVVVKLAGLASSSRQSLGGPHKYELATDDAVVTACATAVHSDTPPHRPQNLRLIRSAFWPQILLGEAGAVSS